MQVLQKEIAHVRGVSVEQLHSASTRRRTLESDAEGKEDKQTDAKSNTGAGGKRKYRRHPKVRGNLCSSHNHAGCVTQVAYDWHWLTKLLIIYRPTNTLQTGHPLLMSYFQAVCALAAF